MIRKICLALLLIGIHGMCVFGQKRTIREKYFRITPYVSTLDDVTRVYGGGHDILTGRDDYLNITYTTAEHTEVSVHFFRDCNQADKPETERTWIVREVFFTFEKELKLRPKDIIVDKKAFTGCPYGDVGGQIIYFNKDKPVEFTYLRLSDAVVDLSIYPTEENKARFACRKDEVRFSLDPKDFRCQ